MLLGEPRSYRLARRAEHKLGPFADLLANAALPAGCRPGGLRYSKASGSERELRLTSAVLANAARYRAVPQGEHATTRSDRPLACRAERKLGLFVDLLANAALPAGCGPGGLRYSKTSRSERNPGRSPRRSAQRSTLPRGIPSRTRDNL